MHRAAKLVSKDAKLGVNYFKWQKTNKTNTKKSLR